MHPNEEAQQEQEMMQEQMMQNHGGEESAVDDDKLALIDVLGSRLSTLAFEQVTAKEPIERRWLEDIRQYQGKYGSEVQSKVDAALNGVVVHSGAYVNKTRHKTNAAEAIIGDLLFPNDQKNWGIEPTPIPELLSQDIENKDPYLVDGQEVTMDDRPPEELQEEGAEPPKAVTKGDVATRAIEIAKDKAKKMELAIEDQFVECDYNGNARDAIHYAAMLGTGILKAPVVEASTDKKWSIDDQGQWSAEIVSQRSASVKFVNPFHIYPDMTAAKKSECSFIFEVAYPIERQVRDLANDPAIIREQLLKVLEQGVTSHLTHTQYQDDLRAISGLTTVTHDNRYELWAYRGELEAGLLKEVGALEEESEEDPLNPYYGVVWFIGATVIKVQLNPNGFEEFPYYFYSWERDHASVFGYGVPYLMRESQNAINVAWRQMLDNSSNTAGAQVVIDKSVIEPEDGDWDIKPFKVWTKKRSSTTNVNDAFSVFSFNNHQNEIAGIFQLAQQNADEESGIPKLSEGQQGQPQTLGEATMQQTNANNDTRRRVRSWDDNVTKPLLRQMYDWNMRYNPDPEIKGDFNVKATGSSTLLAREQNMQSLFQLATQLMPNPQFEPYIKTDKVLRKLIQSLHLDETSLMNTEEDVRAQQEQQQAAMQEQEQPQQEESNQPNELDMAKIQLEDRKIQLKEQEFEFMGHRMAMEERLALMKLAQDKEMTLEQLDAKLAEVRMREKANLYKFQTEVNLKKTEGSGI